MGRWLIAASDFVRTGGMDIANWHLARWLAAENHVELVTHRADSDLTATRNISVTNVKRPFGMNVLGEPKLRKAALAKANRFEGRVVANGGNLPTNDINWVHYVHAAFEPITAGGFVRRLKTRYYHAQCLKTERAAFEAARVIVCNSRLSARHIVERIGIPENRTRVVYYGSDPAVLKPITPQERSDARRMLGWGDEPRAVFVGALGDRRKGFDILYDAWKKLKWDVRLAVIGRGAELEAWSQRAKDDRLGIDFLGFRSDVPQVLAACDVMIHPARYEAYGLGVHEAVARGLPAIVSATAGVSERLGGELLLNDPENVDELVEKLKHWLANMDVCRTANETFAERLRAHTWDDMARQFEECTSG